MNKRIAKKKFKNRISKIITANKNDLVILSINDIKEFPTSTQWKFIKLAGHSSGVNIISIPSKVNVSVLKSNNNNSPFKTSLIIHDIIDMYNINKDYDKIDKIYNYIAQLSHTEDDNTAFLVKYTDDQNITIPMYRCSKCNWMISSQSTQCPNCGRNFNINNYYTVY